MTTAFVPPWTRAEIRYMADRENMICRIAVVLSISLKTIKSLGVDGMPLWRLSEMYQDAAAGRLWFKDGELVRGEQHALSTSDLLRVDLFRMVE